MSWLNFSFHYGFFMRIPIKVVETKLELQTHVFENMIITYWRIIAFFVLMQAFYYANILVFDKNFFEYSLVERGVYIAFCIFYFVICTGLWLMSSWAYILWFLSIIFYIFSLFFLSFSIKLFFLNTLFLLSLSVYFYSCYGIDQFIKFKDNSKE